MRGEKYATYLREAVSPPSGILGKSRAFLRNAVLSVNSSVSRRMEDNFLRCLHCHYVFDDQKERFERILCELKEIGEFIDTDACIEMLLGARKTDKKYFHLSFDDGFRNNFTNALPVLKKLKIPAIFFVPSSLIEADFEKTREYCLETTKYNSVIEMLKWGDLREILSQGFEVGSHTKTHARFSTISNNGMLMRDEILGSKKELESRLDYECKYIAWPYGRLADVDDDSLEMAKLAGYTACFGAYRGTIQPERTNIFSIPRHHFEVQWPVSHVMYFARGNMEPKI